MQERNGYISSNCVHPAIESEIGDSASCFYGKWHCLCLLRKMDCGAAPCVQTALLFRLNYAFTDFLPAAPTCKISTGTIQIDTEKILLFTVRGGELATAENIQRWICTVGRHYEGSLFTYCTLKKKHTRDWKEWFAQIILSLLRHVVKHLCFFLKKLYAALAIRYNNSAYLARS